MHAAAAVGFAQATRVPRASLWTGVRSRRDAHVSDHAPRAKTTTRLTGQKTRCVALRVSSLLGILSPWWLPSLLQ